MAEVEAHVHSSALADGRSIGPIHNNLPSTATATYQTAAELVTALQSQLTPAFNAGTKLLDPFGVLSPTTGTFLDTYDYTKLEPENLEDFLKES